MYIISLSFFSLLLKNYRNTYIKANNKELVETMTTAFDTDIQVYLDQIGDDEEEVKVTGYFKTDDGKYAIYCDKNKNQSRSFKRSSAS